MTLAMIVVFVLICAMLVSYATEKLPLELTSVLVLAALLVVFHLMPVPNAAGDNALSPAALLSGFANPALLSVLALLVMGEGLARTGVLDQIAAVAHRLAEGHPALAVILVLLLVGVVSAFLNNIPVVVLFIPVCQALAARVGHSASRYMMPLSFVAILGGMTTLIGSSTNLLVSSALLRLGEEPFTFFSFTIPGLVVAGVGALYCVLVLPRLLPDRGGLQDAGPAQRGGRLFHTEIRVVAGSGLDGLTPVNGFFPDLKEINVLMILCDGRETQAPFDFPLQAGDVLVAAATREALTALVAREPETLRPDLAKATTQEWRRVSDAWRRGEQMLAEVMVRPGSSYIGKTIPQTAFRKHTGVWVVGVRRRGAMAWVRAMRIQLEAGDVLLAQGTQREIEALRCDRQILLMEWSAASLPKPHHAKRAMVIFLATVTAVATGLLPTVTAATAGAVAMVLSGALSFEEAARALDRQIVFLIGTALALGTAMEATGGTAFLSDSVLAALHGAGPAVILSGFFLLVAGLSNVLSTKATAVLLTPIAVSMAHRTGIPVEAMAVAVVFAANCSFISPVGYQTNLLVMTPGRYRFVDFIRYGAPVLVLSWVAFSLFAPWWYGLL